MVTIDQWGINLRLDSSDFAKDYADANRQVTEAMGKLNRESRLQKIKMDIDMSKFDSADKSVAAFGTRITNLNKLLDIQRNKVGLANMALEETKTKYGDNASKMKQAEGLLMKEQKALADLERQLRQTTKARNEANNAKWAKAGDAAGKAYDAMGAALAGVAVISTKAAIDAVESESLFETSFGGMADKARAWSVGLRQELGLNEYEMRKQAGTLYVMASSLGLATPEAYKLSTSLTELAQDMASFYNLSTEEAFTKLRSGLMGQTEPLSALGIAIDETTVKNTAWAKGIAQQGEELTQQQKVMARYVTIMERTATAQGDLARTADSPANQMRRLKAEAEMLEIELGNKLLPTLVKLMGSLRDVVDAFNGMSKANQDGVLELVKVGAEIGVVNTALAGMAWSLGLPLPWWAKLAVAIGIATKELGNYAKAQEEAEKAEASRQLTGNKVNKNNAVIQRNPTTGELEKQVVTKEAEYDPTTGVVLGLRETTKWVKLYGDELADVEKDIADKDAAIAAGLSIEEYQANQKKRTQLDEERAKEAERLRNLEQDKIRQAAETTQKLTDETYKLTHSAIEAELLDIDRKAEEYRKKKVDEVTITEWAEAAKAKAWEKYENDVSSQLDSVFKSNLQNRLDAIEREKKAWIQKGVDEVKATKWAEEQKRQTLQESAVAAIKEHRDYLDLIRGAQKGFAVNETTLPGGGKIYDVFKGQTAVRDLILQKEREKLGIKPGESFSAELIQEYENTMKWVKSNLVPGLSEAGAQARTALVGEGGVLELNIASNAGQQIEVIRGQALTLVDTFGTVGQDAATRFYQPFRDQMTDIVGRIDASASPAARGGVVNNVSPTINVNIDRPQVRDEADISKIADQVADKITTAIDQKLGGGSNSY